MNIIFDSAPGRIYDFIISLIYACSNTYSEDFTQLNLTPDKNVEEAIEKIRRKITFDFNGSELFFNKETPAVEAFIGSEDLWKNNSIEEYIEYIRNLDERTVKIKILRFLNDDKDVNEDLLMTNDSVVSLINSFKISSSVKWEVYQFIQDHESYMKELLDFLTGYLKVFNNVVKEYKDITNNFDNYVEKNLKDKGIEFINEFTLRDMEVSEDSLYVTTMFFNSHSFIVFHRENGVYVNIGIDSEETIKKLQGAGEIENNLNIFKSLSDGTRFEILRMISQKEMYGQEIAERLGITMATITYHMNFLLGTNIVKVQPEGRKIYYSLNKDTIRKSVRFLSNIFDL